MAREMKNSGIAWIGLIPVSWKTIQIRSIFDENTRRNLFLTRKNSLKFTYGAIVRKKDFDTEDDYVLRTIKNYTMVSSGDIVINGLNLNFDFVTQRVGLVKEEGLITSSYMIIRPRKNYISEYYATYLLKTYDSFKAFHNMGDGVRKILNFSELKKEYIILPPLSSQNNIVNFLNLKCSELDSLVADITKEIELLKEYRKSVIYEAVTKGLDPNVEMKDSGIEWIGKIPHNWDVLPLKNLFVFGKGLSITKANLEYEGYPVISYGQIHAKYNTGVCIDNRLFRYVNFSYLKTDSASLVNPNSFIFADTSEDAEGCGNCVYNNTESNFFAGYHTIILTPKSNKNCKYLAYLFQTDVWRNQMRNRIVEVKLFTVSQKLLKLTSVILPSECEQSQIVEYLDKKCSIIDSLISDKQQQIDKLTEYKKSLIYEYVTGKKEVPAV